VGSILYGEVYISCGAGLAFSFWASDVPSGTPDPGCEGLCKLVVWVVDCFFLFRRSRISRTDATHSATTPTAPTLMPAMAPVESPELPVAIAVLEEPTTVGEDALWIVDDPDGVEVVSDVSDDVETVEVCVDVVDELEEFDSARSRVQY